MIQSVGKQICVRAFWDTHLAHNSPISAILPVLHKNKKTVITKAVDFAHAMEQGLFKQFFFTFENPADAENFISVYSYLAPKAKEDEVTKLELEQERFPIPNDNDIKVAKGSGGDTHETEDCDLFIDLNDVLSDTRPAMKGSCGASSDDGEYEEEECMFANTQQDNWAQEPIYTKGKHDDNDGGASSDDSEYEEEECMFANTQQDNWAQEPIYKKH